MNRITNKHKLNSTGEWCKHPRPFLKRLGNSRLRKDVITPEESPAKWKSKKPRPFRSKSKCPFGLSNIYAQYKDQEIKQHGSCKNCGAIKQPARNCSHCKAKENWLCNGVIMCKNCGKKSAKDI